MEKNTIFPLRTLGQTDIRITSIGFGVMELAGWGGLLGRVFPAISPEEKNAIIKAAFAGGINWFDTAEMYGAGFPSGPWQTSFGRRVERGSGKKEGIWGISNVFFYTQKYSSGLRTCLAWI